MLILQLYLINQHVHYVISIPISTCFIYFEISTRPIGLGLTCRPVGPILRNADLWYKMDIIIVLPVRRRSEYDNIRLMTMPTT